jgi:hypothetical protein
VVEAEIKEKIKSKFYQQAVTDPSSNQKQNGTIFEVCYSIYEFLRSGK